ncbi:MAG: hypothetical protein ABI271_01050, partial [Nitrosospira sp.]
LPLPASGHTPLSTIAPCHLVAARNCFHRLTDKLPQPECRYIGSAINAPANFRFRAVALNKLENFAFPSASRF